MIENDFSRMIEESIQSHEKRCLFAAVNIESRLRELENRVYFMVGLMIGSGILGGATGSLISRIIP